MDRKEISEAVDWLGFGLFIWFTMNLWADYVSLFETRFILKRCADSHSILLPFWLVPWMYWPHISSMRL
uniref:Uncharacterized protein n=1 Tax=Candidatus Kentrum sp. FW TaxID=2126338 RepID=A0A450S621_9GAMM|nr:MAG: hypothetical protein BECKFW1821B_GA0114236_100235 [Candidatus Kentron sp. FW]